jgi:ornithine carbamoyltransferase
VVKKDILSISEMAKDDVDRLIKRALKLKALHKQGMNEAVLSGKSLGLLFEKPSTRTRLSFEAAMIQLGGTPIYISTATTQMARQEPVRDTARVLSRYLDVLAIRTYSQKLLEQFAKYSDIPVINALTDLYHPCQVLSDIMTVVENKGGYKGLKIAWVGDGNNMAHSWINAAALLGFELAVACPENYYPQENILKEAVDEGIGNIFVTSNPESAVSGADVVNTDVWASMGKEGEAEERKKVFYPYQLNGQLLRFAKKDAIVLLCLPAHREEEISEDVLEGPQSVVWEQAENKLHMHKPILETLIRKN